MKTPNEKYRGDIDYARLVDSIESFIHEARFTPSEIREACMLACIRYEMRRTPEVVVDREALTALQTLERKGEHGFTQTGETE